MPEKIIRHLGGIRHIEPVGLLAKLCRHMIYGSCPYCRECGTGKRDRKKK